MSDLYTMVAGVVLFEPDILAWARWYQTANRQVAETLTPKYRVSTVFLGLDHGWGKGPPILFETMVFCDESTAAVLSLQSYDMDRYCTVDQALEGHARMVAKWAAASDPVVVEEDQ